MAIFGTTTAEVETGAGTFFCPACSRQQDYRSLRVEEYASVWVVRLWRTRVLHEYLRCRGCQGAFPMDQLGLQIPTAEHWTPQRIRVDLASGTALEVAFAKLMYCGLDENTARRMIAAATGDHSCYCSDCDLTFVSTVEHCSNCRREISGRLFEEQHLKPRVAVTGIKPGPGIQYGASDGFRI
jgi:hypothetical protein